MQESPIETASSAKSCLNVSHFSFEIAIICAFFSETENLEEFEISQISLERESIAVLPHYLSLIPTDIKFVRIRRIKDEKSCNFQELHKKR